jgi:hypothetical protein
MRYYELSITDASGNPYQLDPNGLGFTQGGDTPTFSSLYTSSMTNNAQLVGQTNPNALNIEFDLPVAPMHEPDSTAGAWIRVWGIGLRALGQAANLNPVNGVFKQFTLRAGMAKGLPLANPVQQGIVAQGQIFQAFGNWQGVNQTLDLICIPGPIPTEVAISWSWIKGQPLTDALSQMFAQAFPDYTPNINISPNLIAPYDQPGGYVNLNGFAQYLNAFTRKLGAQTAGAGYPGVAIWIDADTINASDGAGPTTPRTVALNFQDLVGQPTWIKAGVIMFPTTLRGDIDYSDLVTFPQGVMPPYALTQQGAAAPNAPASSSVVFQGSFKITTIHHYANFRQADAASWNTTFTAIPVGTTPP